MVVLRLKVFGPYRLRPRVGEKLEEEFNSWAEKKRLDMKNMRPVTASFARQNNGSFSLLS